MSNQNKDKQAKELNQEILSTLKEGDKQLRKLLAKAKVLNIHEYLDFGCFKAYLEDVAEKTGYSINHLRRIAKEGEIEELLLGTERVGSMTGAVLRALSENVQDQHVNEVFETAMENKKKERSYPTAADVIKAAKDRSMFKELQSRTEPDVKNEEHVQKERPDRLSIGQFDPEEVAKEIFDHLGKSESKLVLKMIFGSLSREARTTYSTVRNGYTVRARRAIHKELKRLLSLEAA